MIDDLPFMWYYLKSNAKSVALAGALTVLLWAGIVVYLNELQMEAEYGDWEDGDREEV